jgi:thiamine biosynthesis lipoprotein
MHSHEAPYDLCSFWLADEAVATSGIDYRTWERGGQKVHHLIDPATGAPALTGCLTVTILDGDAVRAEAWATASLIAGSDKGMNALQEAGLAGLFVSQYGDVLVSPHMHQRLQLPPTYQDTAQRARY